MDSAGSEFSQWSDTGDLAEQLADEEDPLQIQLPESLEHQLPRGRGSRSEARRQKHVHYAQEVNHGQKPIHPGVSKEAIQIPEPEPRSIGRLERYLAKWLTGNSQASNMRGLTGRPLLYAVPTSGDGRFQLTFGRYFTSVFVSLGVFLFGYDQGVMSGIIT